MDIPNLEILGGDRWSAADLEQIAAGTAGVALLVDNQPSGLLTNIRRVGRKLLADARDVPAYVRDYFATGRVRKIGTEVFTDLADGIRRVHLITDAPARSYGSPTAEAVKCYEFDRVTLTGGAACAQEHEESEMETVEPTKVLRTEDIDVAVVARVRAYQAQDPSLSFEAAYRQLAYRDPALWRLYGAKAVATLRTVAVSPAEQRAAADWREAGLEILREADRYQQASPELSREEAIRAVLRDNAELTRRYARGSSPPGA